MSDVRYHAKAAAVAPFEKGGQACAQRMTGDLLLIFEQHT
jgi:hypothetical protein